MFQKPSSVPAKCRSLAIFILLVILCASANAQNINSATPVRLYYYDFKLTNPAFTGTNAKHAITTDYAGDPNGFGSTQIAYASYEANIKSIRSGLGVIASVQELGIQRFTDYGLLYSKHLQVNEESGFYIGMQLAYQRTRIDYTKLALLTPDDPVIGPGIERVNSFNAAFGVAYYSPIVTVGAGFKNVLITNDDTPEYNVLAMREFKISEHIATTPSLLFVTDSKYNSLRLNNSFEFFQWVLLGAGYTFPRNGRDNLDVSLGLNIKDRVQLLLHLYASEYGRSRANNNSDRVWAESMVSTNRRSGRLDPSYDIGNWRQATCNWRGHPCVWKSSSTLRSL